MDWLLSGEQAVFSFCVVIVWTLKCEHWHPAVINYARVSIYVACARETNSSEEHEQGAISECHLFFLKLMFEAGHYKLAQSPSPLHLFPMPSIHFLYQHRLFVMFTLRLFA